MAVIQLSAFIFSAICKKKKKKRQVNINNKHTFSYTRTCNNSLLNSLDFVHGNPSDNRTTQHTQTPIHPTSTMHSLLTKPLAAK